ncbi:Crp/Fnr family transcriptional regulator [Soonwooa sp.]|uniref:Crp/Fnr family transcriptional regulator n=1 Tax=Soonwooa sp. TaxID=1938592 RepID=UPI00260C0032|nr:Crp/Fnr family transcriptional regulator [Soonwooa sp.]
MFEELKQKLQLTDQQWNDYFSCFHKIEVAPRTILLQENEIAKKMFIIEKGCIRVWFNNDGKEVTLQFFFEKEAVGSLESFFKNMPSVVHIETVEPCVIWWIHNKDLDRILSEVKEIPYLRDMYIDKIFQRTFDYMNYFFSTIKDTPEKRYLNLMKERPQIIKRVPQHYIASYLGISSVHLSRIKNKLIKKK